MAQLIEYKCPRCGGTLEFDSALQKLKCPYCESVFTMDYAADKDDVLDSTEADSQSTEEGVIEDFPDEAVSEFTTETTWTGDEADSMNVYQCQSCRGEIIATDTTAATSSCSQAACPEN